MFGQSAPSGAELLLKSLGLGEVITQAQQIAKSGAAEAIIKFGQEVPQINERLERIETLLTQILGPDGAGRIQPTALPGTGSGDGGLDGNSAGPESAPKRSRAHR